MADTANVLETEGMLEYMYALKSIGDDLRGVSQDLRIPITKIKLMMKSSPQRRRRYLEAEASNLAEGAFETLAAFKGATALEREQKSAADHARQIVDLAGKLVSSESEQDSGPKVVVNSTVVIGENQAPPPLPAELEGIVIDVSPK